MHIAAYLAAIVLVVAIIRGAVYLVQHIKTNGATELADRAAWGRYLACLGSGVLFTNAVPHFVHGVSGETFPAPLGLYLGTGFPEHVSNVLWGFVNIVLGYNLFRIGKVAGQSTLGRIFFFAGVLLMGIFLSFVFSHGGR